MAFAEKRAEMVIRQLRRRGLGDPRVLDAMNTVPRHDFVPREFWREAYADTPLPLGPDQTISQPYIVGLMLEKAELAAGERTLEIGTGSGYQAALLAELGTVVHSVERDAALSARAAENLTAAGYPDVELRVGDGRLGWPEAAPFDAILVTAAPAAVPPALIEQLAEGGRLIIPVGAGEQRLLRIRRERGTTRTEDLLPVRFVPLRGDTDA